MFGKLKDTFDKSIATVSVKSESLVETSRIKSTITNTQKRMDAEISALGLKFYQAWCSGQVSVEMFQEDLQAIHGIEQEIQASQARLEQIKEEENRILGTHATHTTAAHTAPAAPAAGSCFCTNCGKNLPAGSRFCDNCGTPVG